MKASSSTSSSSSKNSGSKPSSSASSNTSSKPPSGKSSSASSPSTSRPSDTVALSKESQQKESQGKVDGHGVNLAAWKSSDDGGGDKTTENKTKPDPDLAASLGDKNLKTGMHDESVRSLQSSLNDKLGMELETDGKFGPKTKAAVEKFQAENGLEVDGIVGPKTKAALTGANDEKAKARERKTNADSTEKGAEKKTNQSGMSFGKKLSAGQKTAINQMVSDLKAKGFEVKASDIANFMAVETGGTFSPSIRSGGKRNGAVGLAQFTGIAIKDLNQRRSSGDKLSKARLSKMGFGEQSKVVTDYLSTALGRKKMQGKSIDASDLYAAVFSPAAIGKSAGATIYSSAKSPRNYNANRSLDTNRDGRITKAELTARLDKWARRGQELFG